MTSQVKSKVTLYVTVGFVMQKGKRIAWGKADKIAWIVLVIPLSALLSLGRPRDLSSHPRSRGQKMSLSIAGLGATIHFLFLACRAVFVNNAKISWNCHLRYPERPRRAV